MKSTPFSIALVSATWAPLIYFVVVSRNLGGPLSDGFKAALVLAGSSHVLATISFYRLSDFVEIARTKAARYIWFPLALILGSAACYALLAPTLKVVFLCVYWMWQAWHYGRQNLGVNAFIASDQGASRRALTENRLITAGSVIGVLATPKILAIGLLSGAAALAADASWIAAKLLLIPLLIAVVVYLLRIKEVNPMRILMLITSTMFFAPGLFAGNIDSMFSSYAVAHGFQYFVFMTVVNAPLSTRGFTVGGVIRVAVVLLAFSCATGFLTSQAMDVRKIFPVIPQVASDALMGSMLGVTMSHFVIDAGIWKLSKQDARAFLSRHFAFVLGGRTQPARSDRPGMDASDRPGRAPSEPEGALATTTALRETG